MTPIAAERTAAPVEVEATTLDRPVPHELQLEMVARLPRPAEVIELETGHIPAVTHSERFADLLLGAVG